MNALSTDRPPPEVRRLLRRLRFRLLALRALRALGVTAALGSMAFLAALLADRFFILSNAERLWVTFSTLGATGAAAAFFLLQLAIRPLGSARLAQAIEARRPELGGSLLSVIELAAGGAAERRRYSTELLERLWRSSGEQASALAREGLADHRPARRAASAGALALLALGSFAAADFDGFGQLARRFAHPTLELPRPARVAVEVSPGDLEFAAGDDVEVVVTVARGTPREVLLLERRPGEPWHAVPLAGEGEGLAPGSVLRHRFHSLRRTLEYRVRAGDSQSPLYRLEPRPPPRPVAFLIAYRYPAYSGLSDETVESFTGDLRALAGAEAELRLRADCNLSRAAIVLEDGERREAVLSGSEAAFSSLSILQDGAYRLELESDRGIRRARGIEYAIEALPDLEPSIEILEPRAAETAVEPESLLEVRYRAEDDVGLHAVELVARRVEAGSGERVLPLQAEAARGARPRLLDASWMLDVAAFALGPGEGLSFFLRARDALGQEARSTERLLRVAFHPDPPEGAGWLAGLRSLRSAIGGLEQAWQKALPSASGDPPETIAPGSPRARALERAVAQALEARLLAAGLMAPAVELGRSIAVPSPNRQALEALGFALGEWADGAALRFWRAAVEAAGRLEAPRAAGRAEEEVDAAPLYTAHQAAAERLREIAACFEEIQRAERLEEVHARLSLLAPSFERLGEDLAGGEPVPESANRLAALERELAGAAAELALLAAESEGELANAVLGSLSRAILSSVVGELETSREALEKGRTEAGRAALQRLREALRLRLPQIAAELAARERLAATARERLEPAPAAAAGLARLAALARGDAEPGDALRLSDAAEELALSRQVLAELAFAASRSEAHEVLDFETTSILAALRELLEQSLEERLAAGGRPEDGAARAAFLLELSRACAETEPPRLLGRAIQELEWIAAGEEALAWKLRSARAWNPRTLNALRRAQLEVLRALRATLARLAVHGAEPAFAGAHPSLAEALRKGGDAETALREALALLEATPPAPEEALPPARRAARLAGEAAQALEELRSRSFPEAAAAAEWLKAQRGTLAQRIARLAEAEASHAARVREAAPAAAADPELTESLGRAHEALRERAAALAAELRREGSRRLAARGGGTMQAAFDRAAGRLDGLVRGLLLQASRALFQAKEREDAAALLAAAAADEERAAEELRDIAEALSFIEEEEMERLAGSEIAAALEEASQALEGGDDLGPELVAGQAKLLLEAALAATRALAARLAPGPLKEELLAELGAAAAGFRRAIALVERNELEPARESLQEGLESFRRAVAIARRLRGEAEERLASSEPAAEAASDPAGAGSAEEAEIQKELEKILALRARQREIEQLIDELLREGAAAPESLEEAARRAAELAEGMGEEILTTTDLVKMVAKLLVIDRQGKEIAEAERYLEEETRRFAALGEKAPRELAAEQKELVSRGHRLVEEFLAAGFKLTFALPDVFKAFGKAAESGRDLLFALEEASRQLESGKPSAAEALAESSLQIGIFLAGVDGTRRRALEAIAGAEGGAASSGAAQASLERALRSAREAAQLLAAGRAEAAAGELRSSGRGLSAAAGALRGRLEQLGLSSGGEGGLLSRLLEEEAARLGLVWMVPSRGEEFAAGAGEPAAGDPADMPFPEAYKELIRIYLRAIAARE